MASPLVSVIIPTYNRAAYIGQAIESVLAQTLEGIEIIVADDGSTDDTEDRVRAYGDRVRYVRTTNGGSAHARNVGMAHAHGKYLAFLDSDDLFYPWAMELESRFLDEHPDVDMVYADVSGFDDEGFFDRYHLKTYHNSAFRDPAFTYAGMFASSTPLSEIRHLPEALVQEEPRLADRRAHVGHIFDWYLTGLVMFTNSMMVRREVLTAMGPRNEQIKYWEEFDYTLRICRAHKVGFLDVPTYKLRYHADQISTTARDDGKYVWMRKQQILLRVVKRQAFTDAAYYERHRRRVDQYLANLHRAVAVPMMLMDTRPAHRRDYPRRARLYLSRCGRHAHPEPTLWALSFMPAPIRRLGVTVIERIRKRRFDRARRVRADA